MGFVTLEKSEKEELFEKRSYREGLFPEGKNPYAMSIKQLEEALAANAKEQLGVKEYLQNLKRYGGSKGDIQTANSIWLALKTIYTQLSNIKRKAEQQARAR